MHFERVQWSENAEKNLGPALGNDAIDIASSVLSGESALWRIQGADSKKRRGYVVTRIDRYSWGLELVVVAGCGRGMIAVFEHLKKWCAGYGIRSIRFHSSFRGMQRMAERCGFQYAETVYRWTDGQ